MRDETEQGLIEDHDDIPGGPNAPESVARLSNGPTPALTKTEIIQRRQSMSHLLATGRSDDEICSAMKTMYNMSVSDTKALMTKTFERWANEDRRREPHLKAAAKRRIFEHLRKAAEVNQWTAVGGLEKTLASIEGTLEDPNANRPTELRINVAVLKMLGNVDEDTLSRLINKGTGIYLDAVKSGALLPTQGQTIDIEKTSQ